MKTPTLRDALRGLLACIHQYDDGSYYLDEDGPAAVEAAEAAVSTGAGVYRGWINQPSTLQPLHDKHGLRCIVVPDTNGMATIWFTEGATLSMRVDPVCISRCEG